MRVSRMRDRNAAQKHVWRAAIVLQSGDGIGTHEIMRQTGASKTCVWRWQERFAEAVEAKVLAGKVVHVILDNYAAPKHPKVIAWLARHPRFTFHFTPTSASWLNAIEGFFAILTKRARCLPLDHRSPGRHQPIHRRAQSQPKAVRLDQGPRKNHRSRQTRAPSVGFSPLAQKLAQDRVT
jgi:hypothetical protein